MQWGRTTRGFFSPRYGVASEPGPRAAIKTGLHATRHATRRNNYILMVALALGIGVGMEPQLFEGGGPAAFTTAIDRIVAQRDRPGLRALGCGRAAGPCLRRDHHRTRRRGPARRRTARRGRRGRDACQGHPESLRGGRAWTKSGTQKSRVVTIKCQKVSY